MFGLLEQDDLSHHRRGWAPGNLGSGRRIVIKTTAASAG